ncbi:uroporphyrinogen-III synthase [Shimia abyssi]|uniref:Uroporphyrinogen-III synthase n=1 Tax=Shimia abyssi TaxID=1662395 RepID=A0A2P8F042_9RHOB|nr:uroporphyrinogen-III synthase [Shimia abyssi]PSL15089.1 uroporphyrinogen-III synthase [Shimia abyssi]
MAVPKLEHPTILLTRPVEAGQEFAAKLAQVGVSEPIVCSPSMRVEPEEVPGLAGVEGVIFTSQNGVAAVDGRDLPAWCVGDATAAAARSKGWRAISAGGDAETLYQRILADAPQGPLLHLRGEHARGALAERLSGVGVRTRDQVVYRQVSQELNEGAKRLLAGKYPVLVPLFSPRTARLLVEAGPFTAPIYAVVISDAVAENLAGLECEVVEVAQNPDATSMIAAIRRLIRAD